MTETRYILHLIKGLGRGGAETLLLQTLQLHNSNFKFKTIYFLPHKDQLVQEIKKISGVELVNAKNPVLMILKIPKLIRIIRESNASLIHCHLPWSGITGRIAGWLAGVPVIYTEHNLQERYHWFTRKINLLTIGMNQKVLAVSDQVRESILKNKKKSFLVKRIYNGVDTAKFSLNGKVSSVNEKLGFRVPDGGLVVGIVAVFTPKKRLNIWLQIAFKISQKFPKTRFLLVGDGPGRKEMEIMVKNLGIETYVFFAGLQEEVKQWLEMMDIFLMTSEFEGLPVALLEAMSMEMAVSVTNVGGVKEIVNEENGKAAEPYDYDKILENTLILLENEELRSQLGKNARKTVIKKFNLQRMVAELESVYKETIQ